MTSLTESPAPLVGRTILLTGASGGIGAETARALLTGGAHLVAHYLGNRSEVEAACGGAPPERVRYLQADFRRPGAARELWRSALAWRQRIDTVVVNAAIMPDTPIEGTDEEWDAGWDLALRVNVQEPVSLMREALGHYLQAGGGSLITLSSWAAQRGSAIPHLGAYASSKAALKAMAQTIARNYARQGIYSYILAPGIVDTPMSAISAAARGGIEALNAELAMGAVVSPGEVARLIAYLATGEAPNLTGATIDLNGASYIR